MTAACKRFFERLCKVRGISPTTMVMKYPRVHNNKSVLAERDYVFSYCIYCPRLKAMESFTKYDSQVRRFIYCIYCAKVWAMEREVE